MGGVHKLQILIRDLLKDFLLNPPRPCGSGRVDRLLFNKSKSNPNPILWGRDLCLPLTPSTAPARIFPGALSRTNRFWERSKTDLIF